MSLMTRFARLFRADLNALLDRAEEPETLLRLSLREMEEALEEDRRHSLALARRREALAAALAERGHTVQNLLAETALCLDAGQDGLARGAVKRRLEAERALQALGRQRAALDTEWAEGQARIAENQRRLEAIRQQAEALALLGHTGADDWRGDGPVDDDEVEVALLREKQNRSVS